MPSMPALADLTGAFGPFRPLAQRRELVLEAFNRRPEWQVTVQHTECDDVAVQDGSLFFWGEYETIDWEQVHAGEASILCVLATYTPGLSFITVPN